MAGSTTGSLVHHREKKGAVSSQRFRMPGIATERRTRCQASSASRAASQATITLGKRRASSVLGRSRILEIGESGKLLSWRRAGLKSSTNCEDKFRAKGSLARSETS